ncbi:MAG: hypothetical protein QXE79_03620 [Candidatus Bathyarchaeia archaeon]
MDVWMPYGEVEVSVEVADGGLVDILEPKLPTRVNWIEDFRDILKEDATIGLDPVLVGLCGENLVNELSMAIREKVPEGRLKIVLASNLYHMPLSIDEYLKKANFETEPWRGDIAADIILSALLPHPLLGFCGAPHIACLGHLESPSLFDNPDLVEGVKSRSLEDNPLTSSILEEVNSSPYVFHLTPYKGEPISISKGGLLDAFKEGVRRYMESFKINESRPILVVSVGGYPFDATILNMIHTLRVVRKAVVEGGELILLSECGGVLTDPSLLREVMGLTPKGTREPLVEDLMREVSEVTDIISVRLVSILPNSYARKMGFKPADTATAAFLSASRRIRDTRSLFIPWGYHAVT